MTATATSNYIGQAMQAKTALAPPSFADNPALLVWNLFVMTAAMCLGLLMAGKQARRIWAARRIDLPTNPVSVYRIINFLTPITLREGEHTNHQTSTRFRSDAYTRGMIGVQIA